MLLHEWLLRASVGGASGDVIVRGAERWDHARLLIEVARVRALLERAGLGCGHRVVVQLEPEPTAIAVLLALVSLGAAYVPLDPDLPSARAEQVLKLVSPAAIIGPVRAGHVAGLAFTETIQLTQLDGSEPLRRAPQPDDPAYMIMTSGSTGLPKGIVMSHSAAVAALRGFCELGVAPRARVGSISPLHFDFSMLDLGLALGTGATLVQVPRILAHQPRGFIDYLATHRVTQMDGVPSIWRPILAGDHRELLAGLKQLDTVVYGAESFAAKDVVTLQAWRADLRIVQAFGHSESIGCCFKVLEHPVSTVRGRISLGHALPDTEVFALNDAGNEVGEGEPGELYVAGPHLFSGYLGDPAQTAARLIPDPRPAGRQPVVFRSGDLVFRDAPGEWYFLGRIDHQVKVRGNRVELSEVERVLEQDVGVSAAVAVVSPDGATLTAFVVPIVGQRHVELSARLRAHLSSWLPRYMIPRELRFLDAMPMLANGKVDRHELIKRIAAPVSAGPNVAAHKERPSS
jgi:amino acid adenylation domain-containing protein